MALDADLTFVNPLADGSTADQVGGNLELSVAAGATHDLWTTNKDAIYAYVAASNTDFDAQIKFVGDFTVTTGQSKMMGMLFLNTDTQNCVRFDIFADKTGTPIKMHNFAATIAAGTATTRHLSDLTNTVARDFYLRVNRTGNTWTFYTYDTAPGVLQYGGWVQRAQFDHTIVVNRWGIFAGNTGGASAPAFLAKFDYLLSDHPPNGVLCDGVITEPGIDVVSGSGEVIVTANGVVLEITSIEDGPYDYAIGSIVVEALQDIPKFYDRVHETSTTEGLVDFVLDGAFSADHKLISDRYAIGDEFYYTIISRVSGGGWESGLGYLDSNGKLVRSAVYSSNTSDLKINFGSGPKDIIVALSAHYINDLADRLHAITVRLTNAGI